MPEHIELDMIPALIDSTHLQEWVDLCEEFVAHRPQWKTKILTSLLACTLHNPGLYRLFREKTKDGDFNDWPEVWQTMRNADIEAKSHYLTENGLLLGSLAGGIGAGSNLHASSAVAASAAAAAAGLYGRASSSTTGGGAGVVGGGRHAAGPLRVGSGAGSGAPTSAVGAGGIPVFGSSAGRYMPYPKVEMDGLDKASAEKKMYICEECSREFRRPEHLKRHYRSIHTNEKPFECVYCQKRFSRSDNLAQHERSHARKKRIPNYDESDHLPDSHSAHAHDTHSHVDVNNGHTNQMSHHRASAHHLHEIDVGVVDHNVDNVSHHHSSHHHDSTANGTTSTDEIALATAIVGKGDVDDDDENVAATLKAATEQHV